MNTTVEKTRWTIDPTHSELLFKVKHLMITNVKGEFRNFTGQIITEGDSFEGSKVNVDIDATSIFTNQQDRDTHLKSSDFFDVEQHPRITFHSKRFEKVGEDFILTGDLSIRGISKEISLNVEYGGTIKDPYGNTKSGFSISGTINRKDWGLNWNAALETGGVMVSNEVKINGEVQFVKEG